MLPLLNDVCILLRHIHAVACRGGEPTAFTRKAARLHHAPNLCLANGCFCRAAWGRSTGEQAAAPARGHTLPCGGLGCCPRAPDCFVLPPLPLLAATLPPLPPLPRLPLVRPSLRAGRQQKHVRGGWRRITPLRLLLHPLLVLRGKLLVRLARSLRARRDAAGGWAARSLCVHLHGSCAHLVQRLPALSQLRHDLWPACVAAQLGAHRIKILLAKNVKG